MDEVWHDSELIGRAIGGDRGALDALWRSVRRWVGAVVLAHKPREADLEDLMQQVALTVCKGIAEVRDPESFKPWLRRVAINTARAEGRKTTRRKSGFMRFAGSLVRPQSGDGRLEERMSERAGRVLDAAMDLPEKYREAVILRCVHSMSHRQIGEVMGLPETTVETRIARGRRMLREAIAQREARELNTTPEPAAAGAVSGGAS